MKSIVEDMAAKLVGKQTTAEKEYVHFNQYTALVIDDIGAMRHAIKSQLQSIGMNQVSATSNALDALRMIDVRSFDLIMCDYNLNSASSGQHLLEHLRNEHMIDAKTIFIMLTAEAEYAFVANAVEFSPDDYILKPCQEKKLKIRLERLFDRRTFLLPVYTALDAGLYDAAIAACDALLDQPAHERWLMDVLRLKADAQLAKVDISGAQATYQQASMLRDDTPWINIGIARTHYLLKDYARAAQIAEQIIANNPSYVAAYELLAQIKERDANDQSTLDLLQQASKILPSAKRYRAISESAFLLGDLATAKKYSKSAINMSQGSLVETPTDFLALAQIQTDMGDHKDAISTLEKEARKYEESGLFGISKNAILAQAYFETGETNKAQKLVERGNKLVTETTASSALTALGKAALKTGDLILGLKLLTNAIQSSGKDRLRITKYVTQAMQHTGQQDKIDEVINAGQKKILLLVDAATKAMRTAHFSEANDKIIAALAIHDENIEALLAAAQLHLLWLKQEGMQPKILERAKYFLATLDRLLPNNEKVMGFYRFFNELKGD